MSEIISANDADGNFRITFCKKKKGSRLIAFGPEDIGEQ